MGIGDTSASGIRLAKELPVRKEEMRSVTIQPKEYKMTANSSRIFVMTASLLMLAGLMFTGCSQSPVEPNVEPSQPQVLSRSAAFTSQALANPIPLYTEAVVSAKTGGQLTLFDVVLDVPPGAFPVDTTYSINIPDINVFYNEFGTDGLVFDVPVTVTMSYRNADLSGVDESTIRIGWWDESNRKWVDMKCTVDRENQTVTGQLYHFSAYALVSD
jgi:hypothetical protein